MNEDRSMKTSGIEIKENVSLAPLTSWRVGGNAQFYTAPRNIEEVKAALCWAEENSHVVTVLGGGSNILVSDKGISGLVLSMRLLSGIETHLRQDQLQVIALAGTHKSQLLRVFLQHQLAPALFLSGLPGDVGGGVVMNAGVSEARRPREFCELVEWVEVVRSQGGRVEVVRLSAQQIQWTYRHSKGWQPGVIVRVGLTWPNEPVEDISQQVKEVNRRRLSKQPLDLPSGGSVFKNPSGMAAGALIDQCGLKGFSIGGAKVSERHANFIVNFNGATAQDINGVIQHVQKQVLHQTGVELKTEIIYLGKWS